MSMPRLVKANQACRAEKQYYSKRHAVNVPIISCPISCAMLCYLLKSTDARETSIKKNHMQAPPAVI